MLALKDTLYVICVVKVLPEAAWQQHFSSYKDFYFYLWGEIPWLKEVCNCDANLKYQDTVNFWVPTINFMLPKAVWIEQWRS